MSGNSGDGLPEGNLEDLDNSDLEAALRAAPPGPLDLLVWRQAGPDERSSAGPGELPGLEPWEEGSWPDAWAGAAWHHGRVDDQRVVVVTTPPFTQETGWSTALPVWWAASRGARALLVLSEGRATGRSPVPAGVVHAVDHLDLTASSPLIGLGASSRGPLFPDRTEVLHPDLVPAAERVLASMAGVVACLPTEGPGLEARGQDALELEADVTTRGAAAPLAAAAHAGLPTLLLVRVQADALFAEDAPMPVSYTHLTLPTKA